MNTIITTRIFDASEYLGNDTDKAEFAEISFETDADFSILAGSVYTIARAIGMSVLAEKTGMDRKELYNILNNYQCPEIERLKDVLKKIAASYKEQANDQTGIN